jgi:predicted metalloprotease with PDZ domain
VTLRLKVGPEGRVELHLPDSAAGATELWRYLQDIKVEGATSVRAPKPSERLIDARPGATITVLYRVVSAYAEPAHQLDSYKPQIWRDSFWIYGEALFAYSGDIRTATFRWTRAPSDFGFASSLERPHGEALPRDDLIESVSVGGRGLEVSTTNVGGSPVRVASLGRFDVTNQAIADMSMKVIAGERRFWGGHEPPFLVVLNSLPSAPGSISVHGEGRADAFDIQAGVNTPLEYFKSLLAHEYFHNWNPPRLGGTHDGDAERADYWFSEGFTDFYARKLTLRSGVFSLEEFVRDWNQMLDEYAASPTRAAPVSRVVADFWKDSDVQKLPYRRGSILAATWDRELRARSGGKVGMDQVMLAMRDRAAKLGPKSPKAPELFEATMRGFGLDARPDVEHFVKTGAAAMLPKDAFGGCITVTTRQAPRFETGYQVETKDGVRVLTKVDPEGPAYAAGLRDRMTYVRRVAGGPGNSAEPWKIRISENGQEREVSYLPAGKGMVTLQQLELPKDLNPAAREVCARAVAAAR